MRVVDTRTMGRLAVTSLVVATLCLSMGRSALAQSVGFEFDLGIPVGDTADVLDVGWGLEGRAGFELLDSAITFELEALFDWYKLPYEEFDETLGIWRLAGGLVIGLPIPLIPKMFGHVGYGKATIDSSAISVDQSGFTWDVGLRADLLSPGPLSLGIHIALKVLSPGDENGAEVDDITWVGLGIHGEFGF